MAGYVKLFASILDSTVWKLPPPIKVVWLTMMAMADRDGVVEAALPGLADRARVKLKTAEKAVAIFLAPDPHSKTPDQEGRRIEVVPRGWRLLNYEAYRELQSVDDRRSKNAERQRRFRDRRAGVTPTVTQSNVLSQPVTVRDAHCSASVSGSDLVPPPDPSPSSGPPDQTQAPARSNGGARIWAPFEWCRRYGSAWCEHYRQIAYGQGGDSKGCANLAEILERLPESERLAAQAIAPQMFAEFLGREGSAAQRRHPFVFFVQEWGGLRVPAAPAPKPAGPSYRKL